MSYNPTSEDIAMLSQPVKDIYSKIDLLDKNFKTIDSIEGVTIDGTISIDADSDIRYTYSSTIYVKDDYYITDETARIWLDKYIRVWIGILNLRTQKIHWYPLGLFKFNTNGFMYSSTEKTLSVSCVDLIATIDGTLSGELTGLSTQINEGENIRDVLIRTIQQLGGYNKYLIDYVDKTVPYDLKYGTGSTVFSIIKEVRDLYYLYETFFDEDTFICQEVPTCEDDPIFIPYNIFDQLIISESTNNDFSEIRNCSEVWGKSVSSDYYSDSVQFSDNIYTLTIEDYNQTTNKKISFIPPINNPENAMIKINDNDPLPLINDDGNPLSPDIMIAEKVCVIRYTKDGFKYVGQSQIHAMVMLVGTQPTDEQIAQAKIEENCDNLKFVVIPDSPYTIEKIGRKNKIYSGGEFENISTDELAMERAEYENWKTARLTDSVSVECVIIPWLTVNKKISHKPYYSEKAEVQQYIIKHIDMSLSDGTMSISMCRFFPYYPYIIDKS